MDHASVGQKACIRSLDSNMNLSGMLEISPELSFPKPGPELAGRAR